MITQNKPLLLTLFVGIIIFILVFFMRSQRIEIPLLSQEKTPLISMTMPILPDRIFVRAPERYALLANNPALSKATFAGGCFWCMEGPFETIDGVEESFSGYSGGTEKDPTYEMVSSGNTSHRESVQIFYDPEKVSYETLLETFFRVIDPTDDGGQFNDRGFHYTTALFFHSEYQKEAIEKKIQSLNDSGLFSDPVVTAVLPFLDFYLAEEDHQNFYLKQSITYKQYARGSGRESYIETHNKTYDTVFKKEESNTYQKPSPEAIAELDPLSYHVLIENGTEKPFENEYWDNTAPGIYIDKLTRKPLFSSTHKYDSGTGWPTFYKSLQDNYLVLDADDRFGMNRTEVRSESSDTHLGHLFDDGPKEHGGQRFCLNSASLLFVPLEDLKSEGFSEFLPLFESKTP